MEKVRIGLIGAGGISRAHLDGFRRIPEKAVVTAVADVRREAAEAAAAGGAEVYEDWRELLERAPVDAVDICLPHDLHAPVAVAAAECGKHVMTEKVMARTLEECDRMIAAAEGAGVKLMVCHDRRYHSLYARIKELVEEGAVGRPLLLRLDHNQDVNVGSGGGKHWIYSKERLGGGAVMSCLVHQFDLMRWYGGEVTQVGGLSLTLPERMEGETIGVVQLRFAGGALGDAVINWALRGRGHIAGGQVVPGALWYELVWISGTEGNLHTLGGIHVFRNDASEAGYQPVAVDIVSGHAGAMAHFVDCIREDRPPLTDGREGRAALEIALAAYQSEAAGRFVDLPLKATIG